MFVLFARNKYANPEQQEDIDLLIRFPQKAFIYFFI